MSARQRRHVELCERFAARPGLVGLVLAIAREYGADLVGLVQGEAPAARVAALEALLAPPYSLSQREVAALFGVDPGTVRYRLGLRC